MSQTGLRSRLARIRRRLSGEEGIVLVAVMGVMGVLLLVTAYVASGSEGLSTTTNTDRDTKRALAAAEAGLAVATEELSETALTSGQCLTNVGASTSGTGECTAPTASETVGLGDNTSYRFLASRQQTTGCTSGHAPPVGSYERCITSIGRANGVERRLLRPVQTQAAMFSEAGVVGVNSLYFNNSNQVTGSSPLTLGTNGQVTMVNSNVISGTFNLPASAPTISAGTSSSGWTRTTRASEWSMEAVGVAIDKAWGSNNNSSLPAAIFNSSTKRFEMANSDVRTIAPGTYVFCEMRMPNSAKLSISGTAAARIFIDSPLRAGSPCPAAETTGQKLGRGRLIIGNSGEINLSAAASRLQFVVAGTADETNNFAHVCPDGVGYKEDVLLCNSVKLNGTIYAPRSTARAQNSVEIGGAIAASSVSMINSVKFNQPTGLTTLTLDVINDGSWYECKAQPSSSSDRESGCLAP